MKMIVCVAEDFGIGNNNDLLFSLPPDMKFFRETTMGKVIIMGRGTLDSFPNGKPLKNRTNIVLTRDKNFSREGVIVLHSKEEILDYVNKNFSFRLSNIIEELDLLRPIYKQTACYGHFGRNEFSWEKIKKF